MQEPEFWQIIEAARGEAETDADFGEHLKARLEALDDEDLFEFEEVFWDVRDRADLPALRTYVRDLTNDATEDIFMDFKDWLVSLGQEPFYTFVREPERVDEVSERLIAWDIPSGMVFNPIYEAQGGGLDNL